MATQKCIICFKDASQRCPHCIAVGVMNLWYCGRECYIKDWKQGHANLHPSISGKTLQCTVMRDGSLATILVATNPATGVSAEVEFHLDSKCSTAVITQDVAQKLQLKFGNLAFFVGESKLADDSDCIAATHPITLSIKGVKSAHNPTVIAYVSSGNMCLAGATFLRNICAQLDFSKGTIYVPSVWNRNLPDLDNVEQIARITVGVLQGYYEGGHATLSGQQMRETVLVNKLQQELEKDPAHKLKIMAVDVPIDFNSDKWTKEIMAEMNTGVLQKIQLKPNLVCFEEPPSPPIPELLSFEQVEHQKQQGVATVESEVGNPPELV